MKQGVRFKRWPWLVLVAICCVVIVQPSHDVSACGSASYADLGALGPVDASDFLSSHAEDWSYAERAQLRFIYPFLQEQPARMKQLWAFSYDGLTSAAAPSQVKFQRALQSGQRAAAKIEALALIKAHMALPPVLAAEHLEGFWRAVEFVELHAHLKGVPSDASFDYFSQQAATAKAPLLHDALLVRRSRKASTKSGVAKARRGSLGFWKLQRDFAGGVPNGWSAGIRRKIAPHVLPGLLADTDAWLRDNSGHILSDLVRLWRVRIHFFAGDSDAAWRELIALLPRCRVRAVAEMRYLLQHGLWPSDTIVDGLKNPTLIAALAGSHTITPARWPRWWQLSRSAPKRPWAINLQERLLLFAVEHAKKHGLPKSFPATAEHPTALWGKLRAAALIRAGRLDQAKRQLFRLEPDYEQARLAAKYHLLRNNPMQAARVKELNVEVRQYIVRVLVGARGLKRLSHNQPDALLKEALLVRAIKLTAEHRWKDAASLITKSHPKRAKLWLEASKIQHARSQEGDLLMARFLRAQRGRLFYRPYMGWYRALSVRHELLPAGSLEAKRLARHLERSNERWRALEAYISWLRQNPRHLQARQVLAEADHVYNALVNMGGGNDFFWGRHSKTSQVVRALREVGKKVRQTR